MSTDRRAMIPYADGLTRRNRELAEAVKSMERTVGNDDAELFASFRQRITQFIEFRQELVRRGVENRGARMERQQRQPEGAQSAQQRCRGARAHLSAARP
ncbi:hypothetical protein ML401_38840 [Bradyrhizobium sp. 62B]|nr:hypothetical protein ML401_38840 [Bradyrhizobium sp. 62B]